MAAYPLDFLRCQVAKPLSLGLIRYLDRLASEYGFTLAEGDHKKKFSELLHRLSAQGKITLLIDEYDKPITDLLENSQKVKENVETLKDFYSVLKSGEAANLQFTLVIGVSKYGKVSIFSDLNNLTDITLDHQRFANHWFATGTPTFLIKLLRQNQVPAYKLERISADSTLMERADVDDISVLSLLFQTGYLTVKQVHDELTGVLYDLGYPNYEVAQSMQRHLFIDYLGIAFDKATRNIAEWQHEVIAER